MAKGNNKGVIGNLVSQNNLIKVGFAAAVTIWAYGTIKAETNRESWIYKAGQWLKVHPKT